MLQITNFFCFYFKVEGLFTRWWLNIQKITDKLEQKKYSDVRIVERVINIGGVFFAIRRLKERGRHSNATSVKNNSLTSKILNCIRWCIQERGLLNAVIATRVMLRKVSWRDTFTLIPEQNRFSVVIAARSLENRHIFTPTSNCTRRNVLTHATNVVADLLQQGHWRNTIEGIQGKDLSSARCVENASSMVATNYHCIWEHTLVKGHLNVTIVGKVSVIVVVFHAIRKSMPRRSILNASSVARCINI